MNFNCSVILHLPFSLNAVGQFSQPSVRLDWLASMSLNISHPHKTLLDFNTLFKDSLWTSLFNFKTIRMAQWVKVPTIETWQQPEFGLPNSHKGRWRELTEQSCPLIHTVHECSQTHTSCRWTHSLVKERYCCLGFRIPILKWSLLWWRKYKNI